jgi:anti-sigma-K factor RskA
MKCCRRNRKSIALMALDELDVQHSRELCAHLETCEGCRRYLAEISNVTNKLAAVEMESNIQASETFHQQVAARIKAVGSTSFEGTGLMHLWTTRLNWRVLLPLSGAAAVVVLLLFDTKRSEVRLPAPSSVQTVAAEGADMDLLPSIANYQMAACRSLDCLDEMLDREADKIPSSLPVYAASTPISVMTSN